MFRIFLQIIIFISLCFPLLAQAVGIAVSPSSLDFALPQYDSRNLTITNISPEPIIVFVQADDFVDKIVINPSELKLLPDESSQVKIKVSFTDSPAGVQHTNISVVSRAINPQSFNAASGIKIPLTVNIVDYSWQWSGATVFIAVFCGLLVLIFVAQAIFWLLTLHPKKSRWLPTNFLKLHRRQSWLNFKR